MPYKQNIPDWFPMRKICKNLWLEMKKQGHTLDSISDATGISRPTIQAATVNNISLITLLRFVDVLNLDFIEFMRSNLE